MPSPTPTPRPCRCTRDSLCPTCFADHERRQAALQIRDWLRRFGTRAAANQGRPVRRGGHLRLVPAS